MTEISTLDLSVGPHGRWSQDEVNELVRLWKIHGSAGPVAREMGVTRNTIIGKSRRLNLQFHRHKASATLKENHPAVANNRSRFRSAVVKPHTTVALKSGDYSRKIGALVAKGRWKGMAVFTLTLEERATCPRSCAMWSSCYGNNMHLAKRLEHGAALEKQLVQELQHLSRKNPSGFVVRLHILGDFYSVGYVDFWRRQLATYPALHIFGYTARQEGDPIGNAITHLRRDQWARFAVRTSGANNGPRTMVIDRPEDAGGAIICPAQTGKTSSCSTCGLCWATTKPIAFLRH